jgi:hypothetical protein
LVLLLLSLLSAQSVLPALTYSHACSTTIELRNLGEYDVDARVEPHRESGSLVALAEQTGLIVHLAPGEEKKLTLKLSEATENAWALVSGFTVAVSGTTNCVAGNRTNSALREVAHASANPWFEGDIEEMPGARLAVVNTSEATVVVTGCYSGGVLISNPNVPDGGTLRPLCTRQFREQIPPFSARQYPVLRDGNTHFSLHATGPGIALQMLRLLDAGTNLFQVDSSISFSK